MGNSFKESLFNVVKERRFSGRLIEKVATKSQLECLQKCLANVQCHSCNYGVNGDKINMCELSNRKMAHPGTKQKDLIFDKDFIFISKIKVSPFKTYFRFATLKRKSASVRL